MAKKSKLKEKITEKDILERLKPIEIKRVIKKESAEKKEPKSEPEQELDFSEDFSDEAAWSSRGRAITTLGAGQEQLENTAAAFIQARDSDEEESKGYISKNYGNESYSTGKSYETGKAYNPGANQTNFKQIAPDENPSNLTMASGRKSQDYGEQGNLESFTLSQEKERQRQEDHSHSAPFERKSGK